jgi:hypothetical protein
MKLAHSLSAVLGALACFAGVIASGYFAIAVGVLFSSGDPLWSRILGVVLSGVLAVAAVYLGIKLLNESSKRTGNKSQ